MPGVDYRRKTGKGLGAACNNMLACSLSFLLRHVSGLRPAHEEVGPGVLSVGDALADPPSSRPKLQVQNPHPRLGCLSRLLRFSFGVNENQNLQELADLTEATNRGLT